MKNEIKEKNKNKVQKDELLNIINELNYILEPFFKLNYNRIENLKNLLSKLENNVYNLSQNYNDVHFETLLNSIKIENEKYDLIGILPKILYSKKIFKSNEDIFNFSKNILNIDVFKNKKISRQHLIGVIIDKFIEKDYLEQKNTSIKIINYIDSRSKSILDSRDFFDEWDKIIGKKKNE